MKQQEENKNQLEKHTTSYNTSCERKMIGAEKK
jgi:hypothetical protein